MMRIEIDLWDWAKDALAALLVIYGGICLLIPPALLMVLLKILGVI